MKENILYLKKMFPVIEKYLFDMKREFFFQRKYIICHRKSFSVEENVFSVVEKQ